MSRTNIAVVEINGTNLTDHIMEASLNLEVEEIDATTLDDAGRTYLAGLEDGSIDITFHQDFATSSVHRTITGSTNRIASFKCRAATGAISSTNPEFQFDALVAAWSPINGASGELLTIDASFNLTGRVERVTSPPPPPGN